MVLLLASVRAIKRPIVVLELNLKWSEGSLLEKYLARLIYRKVTLLTVLAPSDRNLLIREARINGERVKVLDQWAQPDRFAEVCSPADPVNIKRNRLRLHHQRWEVFEKN